MRKLGLMLFLGILTTITLVGCNSITLPGENGEETTIDFGNLEDGELDISVEGADGEEGSINIGTDEDGNTTYSQSDGENEFVSQTGENVSLPEGFPNDVPFPDSSAYKSANTLTEGGIQNMNVAFSFTEDVESVFSKFKEYAENKGYTINQESKMEGMYSLSSGKDDGSVFSLSILFDKDADQLGSVLVSVPQ